VLTIICPSSGFTGVTGALPSFIKLTVAIPPGETELAIVPITLSVDMSVIYSKAALLVEDTLTSAPTFDIPVVIFLSFTVAIEYKDTKFIISQPSGRCFALPCVLFKRKKEKERKEKVKKKKPPMEKEIIIKFT
jgi:hypothetical protein